MPTFARMPSTMSSTTQVELPQNFMAGQQRQQISELQFETFPDPQSFLVWKFDSKHRSPLVLIFHRMQSYGQRSGDGWFFGQVKILAINCWTRFSKLRDAGREDCLCSEQDHLEFPVQEEGPFLRGRQIAFMIYDYFRVTGAHDTVFDYADLFSVTLHDDNIQEVEQDGTKFNYQCQKFHQMISWKVCTN